MQNETNLFITRLITITNNNYNIKDIIQPG